MAILIHLFVDTRPGKHTKNYGQPPFFMDKSTISMAVFQFANCLFLSCTVDMERNPLILSHPPCIIYRYIPHMVLRNELIPLLNRGTIISH
jgi:hypothetical protein